jgi:transcriptional regulator GlxA family with amidase domain
VAGEDASANVFSSGEMLVEKAGVRSNINVTEAAWQTGFKDASYFSKLYQKAFGKMPSATRKYLIVKFL